MARERAPFGLGGWRPLCAICAVIGVRVEADTLLDYPVCMDHAALLAREGLLRAASIAALDIAREPTTEGESA
jgi:hypothetical protein